MSLFLPSIPQPGDNLDFSQGQLLSNNQGLDAVFGVDHYKFSDATVNKGYHNTVTQPQFFLNTTIPPVYPTAPPVTAANPILFASQPTDGGGAPTTNLGLLQYSKGPIFNGYQPAPSPVTSLQSPVAGFSLAASASSPVFNFSGVPLAFGLLFMGETDHIVGLNSASMTNVFWDGTTIWVQQLPGNQVFLGLAAGTTLQITNNTGTNFTSVFWTLHLFRAQ